MLRYLAPLAFMVFALPAVAQEISLSEISHYLNGLTTAEATFTQKNADGSVSSGKLYIHRPGRMRFEYDPPNKSLVIAGGSAVAIFDPKSNQPPEQYPLVRTPLNLILAPVIDLGQAKMVVGHDMLGPDTTVTAEDPQHPENGTITLIFSPNPTTLRQWIITDATGAKTVVVLSAFQQGMQLGDSLFDIQAETTKRLGR
ncbi:MAG: outer membrane lipoprotein carrier protein LolA [Paracoccaceae bacterium]|nr:outer membrane lipoprotein carrier protein LolA [Paracoccaceae bacterium]